MPDPLDIPAFGDPRKYRVRFRMAEARALGRTEEAVILESYEWDEEVDTFVFDRTQGARLRDWLIAALGNPAGESAWAAHADDGWDLDPYGRCRYMVPSTLTPRIRRGCGKPSVVSLRRGRTGRRWGYCEHHLARYGRVIRDGAVWWDPDAARAALDLDPSP